MIPRQAMLVINSRSMTEVEKRGSNVILLDVGVNFKTTC